MADTHHHHHHHLLLFLLPLLLFPLLLIPLLFTPFPGNDETILPVDFKRAGEIIDDDIHTLMVKPLRRGVRLHAIYDSCHSGSVM